MPLPPKNSCSGDETGIRGSREGYSLAAERVEKEEPVRTEHESSNSGLGLPDTVAGVIPVTDVPKYRMARTREMAAYLVVTATLQSAFYQRVAAGGKNSIRPGRLPLRQRTPKSEGLPLWLPGCLAHRPVQSARSHHPTPNETKVALVQAIAMAQSPAQQTGGPRTFRHKEKASHRPVQSVGRIDTVPAFLCQNVLETPFTRGQLRRMDMNIPGLVHGENEFVLVENGNLHDFRQAVTTRKWLLQGTFFPEMRAFTPAATSRQISSPRTSAMRRP